MQTRAVKQAADADLLTGYGNAMTHVRVWKFRPAEGREQDFQRAYGADGVWAKLFGRADGFRGTSLMRPSQPGGWWLTLDRWESEANFKAFQRDYGEQYRSLDAEFEGIAGEEVFVGTFEED